MDTTKKALLQDIYSSMVKIRSHIFRSFDVKGQDKITTALQFHALTLLDNQPKPTVGELANEMKMSSSAIAQLTDRLVEANLIMRENDISDRRIVRLILTPKGKKHLQQLNDIFLNNICGIFNNLSEIELNMFLNILHKIIQKIDQRM